MEICNSSVGAGHIHLPASFNSSLIADYRPQFIRLLADPAVGRVTVDFSSLDYIDSVGIATLLSWEQSAKARGKTVVLTNCRKAVRDAFRLLGVGRLLSSE